MSKIARIAATAVTGTSFMTASSALMSLIPHQEFREPDQLIKMIERIAPFLSKPAKVIAGWGAHYAMGFAFSVVYVDLWEKKQIAHSLKNGIILGLVSGLLGMLIWKATFKLHLLPPNNHKLNFYLQRIPAHVVFAVFATLGYTTMRKIARQKAVDEKV